MSHLICRVAEELAASLKSVRDVEPAFMSDPDKGAALNALTSVIAQAQELKLRVLAEAHELAVSSGSVSTAAWAGVHLCEAGDQARSESKLAAALAELPKLRAAFAEGRVSLRHAEAVVHSIEALPSNVSREVLARAEAVLVGYCESYDPKQVRRLGRAILHTVDPAGADEAEHQKLLELEKNAAEKTRLTMRCCGDGTTRISARLPDHAAARLATYLHAWTNPRKAADVELLKARDGLRPWLARVPYPRRAGEAFVSLLEAVDPDRLPIHGGAATSLVVTVGWQQLQSGIGAATLSADLPGDELSGLSVGQVRRLACQASILPMVLGADSEILDVGRKQRLFTSAQRTAMVVRDKTCVAEGCDIPAAWCEAHHFTPWAVGGRTDLKNGAPLCSRHHHWIHDPGYETERMTSGQVRFHRRP